MLPISEYETIYDYFLYFNAVFCKKSDMFTLSIQFLLLIIFEKFRSL
jgi:hypothetical protein